MQRRVAYLTVAGALACGAVVAQEGSAMAKSTVELTADHRAVRAGRPVTFTAYATTDPMPSPKDLRLCLQRRTASHGYRPVGDCVKVTHRPRGFVDVFVIAATMRHPGLLVFRAVAIDGTGKPWAGPSNLVTITVGR